MTRALRYVGVALLAMGLVRLADVWAAPDLKTLYDAHQCFQLRDAVKIAAADPFYRGAVAYAFNDRARAEQELRRTIASAPRSERADEARGLLIYVNQRAGRYREALLYVDQLMRSTPNAPGLKNARALFGALSRYPAQSTAARSPSRLTWTLKQGNLFVPVLINGVPAMHMLDTGANFSTVSESEAKRLGMRLSDATATGSVSTGASVAFRLALADTLAVGSVRLRNVAYLVSNDDVQPFTELAPGERGVLGLPVLLALETMRWTNEGRFDVAFRASQPDATNPNLCFEGATPIVRGVFRGNTVGFVLDTGATKSDLWPPFAKSFPQVVSEGQKERRRVTGVGHTQEFDAITLADVPIEVAGRSLAFHPAHVLLEEVGSDSRWYHGRIGLDLLNQTRRVTLDFRAMTLALE